jgi:hypothetical protein
LTSEIVGILAFVISLLQLGLISITIGIFVFHIESKIGGINIKDVFDINIKIERSISELLEPEEWLTSEEEISRGILKTGFYDPNVVSHPPVRKSYVLKANEESEITVQIWNVVGISDLEVKREFIDSILLHRVKADILVGPTFDVEYCSVDPLNVSGKHEYRDESGTHILVDFGGDNYLEPASFFAIYIKLTPKARGTYLTPTEIEGKTFNSSFIAKYRSDLILIVE